MPRHVNSLRSENQYYWFEIKTSKTLWGFHDYDIMEIDDDEVENPFLWILHINHPSYADLISQWPSNSGSAIPLHRYGTTSTETPSSTGIYSKYVYYDWGANWDKVSDLILTKEIQEILKEIMNHNSNDNDFIKWNEVTKWPLLFSTGVNNGIMKQAALRKYLSLDFIRRMNLRIANWYNGMGNKLIKENRISIYDEEIEFDMYLLNAIKSGRRLKNVISMLYRKELFKVDGNLRELLLCAPKETAVFVPFLHKLGEKLSPPGTSLQTVSLNANYSVIVDTGRHVIFDNFRYFLFSHVCKHPLMSSRWNDTTLHLPPTITALPKEV